MQSVYPSVYPTLSKEHRETIEAREVLLIDRFIAEEVLAPEACIDALEAAFREEGMGTAVNRTKANIHLKAKSSPNSYRYASMEGGISEMEVVAIRIKSDMTTPHEVDGKAREDWFCAYPGLFMGLILLFSAKDGALLAILHDAHIQHMRVAATHAIATKYMARKDARVLGILGSGGMAWTHALTFPKIRPIDRIKVYSPNADHRRRFAEQVSELIGIPVEAMDDAEHVVRGSDIVCGCTNAIEPVIMGDWLAPGMHLTICKRDEPDEHAYRRTDRYVVYESPPGIQGVGQDSFFTYKPDAKHLLGVKGGIFPDRQREILSWVKEHKDHRLSSVILGEVAGRDNDRQITLLASEGSGVQFAALSALVYEAAKKKGLGRKLPLIWFLQDVTN